MFSLLLAAVLLLAPLSGYALSVEADISASTKSSCHVPNVRSEWRHLSREQQASYIKGVQCLQKLPAKSGIKGAKTRFDDFQGLHIALTPEVHLVGQFLPWHRRLLNLYEKALREECGYKGSQPYWDWTLDVDHSNIIKSPVFDPVHGFGGNGIDVPGYDGQYHNLSFIPGWTGGGCVPNGPFASYNLSLGPGTAVTNHCLTRSFNTWAPVTVNTKQVLNTTKQPTFELFRIELEGTPVTPLFKNHDGGHILVGGEMTDRFSSPGDPVFYLHHANLDRLWWKWQQADLKHRLYAMSGRSSVDPPFTEVTLEFKLKMLTLGPLVPIADVMDTRNDLLCYVY